mgnify:CR=1 FL=1
MKAQNHKSQKPKNPLGPIWPSGTLASHLSLPEQVAEAIMCERYMIAGRRLGKSGWQRLLLEAMLTTEKSIIESGSHP